MPSARGRAERGLEAALAALAGALDQSRAAWMVIGGIAVIARGVRRLTTDIDAVVKGDDVTLRALANVLARWGIVPRIPAAMDFARANLVLLARHEASGIDLDISFGWTSFELDAIAARARTAYGSVTVPMATAEDLVIFKAMAARPKDVEDAAALLILHPDIDVVRVRRRLSELAALAEEPSLVEGLDAVLAQTRRDTSRGKRPTVARRRRRKPRA